MANVYDEGTRLGYLRHRNFCDEKSARIISELVQFMDEVGNLREQMTAAWLAKEASEAALRTLREASQRVMNELPRAIYGCQGCGGSGVRSISEHHPSCQGDCRQCPVEGQVQCECEGKNVDVAELLDEMRALLTVAAQTPEEK